MTSEITRALQPESHTPTTRTYIRQPEANAGKRIHNGPRKAAALEHVGPSVVAGDKTKRENNTVTLCRSMVAGHKTKREKNTVTLCRSMVAADKTKRENNTVTLCRSMVAADKTKRANNTM